MTIKSTSKDKKPTATKPLVKATAVVTKPSVKKTANVVSDSSIHAITGTKRIMAEGAKSMLAVVVKDGS